MPDDSAAALRDGFLHDGPARATTTLVLAHGAGAPMDHPFMQAVATGLAAAGIHVLRFEFPYMQRRRAEGVRPGPNRPDLLEQHWRNVVAATSAQALFIGGKSMGGRIATMVADELGVSGCVCLGYPFHPAGKPDRLRTAHLHSLTTPTLICQGERDALGRREEVESYLLSDAIQMQWLSDGDHSLKPRKASGRTQADNLAAAIDGIVAFIRAHE
ncbi:MAG: hypothetical protein DK306_001701 [Chloroflexi bacterium]|nr:MAG: hypothetical protein DK306_001701 [Chloroflexota bacterium]